MPSLKDIKRRILSVQKTQQITRAMRMVAAAKLRRSQEAVVSARPYADRMHETLAEVARSLGGAAEHPLLAVREPVKRVEILVVTSDRGLCGAFNSNLIRTAQTAIVEREARGEQVSLALVGRKGVDFFRRRRPGNVVYSAAGIARVEYGHAVHLAEHLCGRFEGTEVDEVVLVYSEFVSAMTQRPVVTRLLPASAPWSSDAPAGGEPFEIEPAPDKLLRVLVPKALEVAIFRALLESQAGEHAARMTAMESATRNTEELIAGLTLKYNRARQAAITKELVEIVSGAEAL
jgi:F-type H+-transporting ATPase subunit gamma